MTIETNGCLIKCSTITDRAIDIFSFLPQLVMTFNELAIDRTAQVIGGAQRMMGMLVTHSICHILKNVNGRTFLILSPLLANLPPLKANR